jgi:hypothetical protein
MLLLMISTSSYSGTTPPRFPLGGHSKDINAEGQIFKLDSSRLLYSNIKIKDLPHGKLIYPAFIGIREALSETPHTVVIKIEHNPTQKRQKQHNRLPAGLTSIVLLLSNANSILHNFIPQGQKGNNPCLPGRLINNRGAKIGIAAQVDIEYDAGDFMTLKRVSRKGVTSSKSRSDSESI